MKSKDEGTQGNARGVRPPHHITDFGTGPGALRAHREDASPTAELVYHGASDDFTSWMSRFQLSSAMLIGTRVSRVCWDRPPLLVARSGFDHYFIFVYTRGQAQLQIGTRNVEIATGDVGVADLTSPGRTFVIPPRNQQLAHCVTLILPRGILAPLLAAPDAVGCQVIPGHSPLGRLARGVVLGLWRHAHALDLSETASITRAAATLVAGGLRPIPGSERQIAHVATGAKRAEIQSFLEQSHISPDQLEVEALCRRFAISRASLYRMFETDGGLVHEIRERQLRQAFRMIVSPAHRHRRILDIALHHGFRTESGFIRAFRRRFGATPGEARAASVFGSGDEAGDREAEPWRRWFAELASTSFTA